MENKVRKFMKWKCIRKNGKENLRSGWKTPALTHRHWRIKYRGKLYMWNIENIYPLFFSINWKYINILYILLHTLVLIQEQEEEGIIEDIIIYISDLCV